MILLVNRPDRAVAVPMELWSSDNGREGHRSSSLSLCSSQPATVGRGLIQFVQVVARKSHCGVKLW